MSSYVPKTFFSFISCDATCPKCPKDLGAQWYRATGCKRLGGHPAETHLCWCGKEW